MGGGGAERVMSYLVNHFSDIPDLNVHLLTFDSSRVPDQYAINSNIIRHNVEQRTSFIKGVNFLKRLIKFRDILKEHKVERVISFMPQSNVLSIISTFGLNIKVLVCERTNPKYHKPPLFWSILRKVFYRFADRVVCQTDEISDWFRMNTSSTTCIIPNFIFPKHFLGDSSVSRNKSIVSVGRQSAEKGHETLILAFAEFVKKNKDWKLELVGNGPCRQKLVKLVDDNKLNSNVIFYDFNSNISSFYQKNRLFVLPSLFEGFPNALLEAMSCGMTVIASDRAKSCLVEHDYNGLVFKTLDHTDLAQKLNDVANDQLMEEKLSSNAKLVQTKFGAVKILQLWEKLIIN